MERDDPRLLSRRRFLGGAAATAGAVALTPVPAALGAAAARNQIPFYGPHQAGIAQPQQRHALFAAFDSVAPSSAALASLLREWSETAAALARNELAPPVRRPPGARDDSAVARGLGPANLTVTFGFGPGLFDGRYGLAQRRTPRLQELPRFEGDRLERRWCGGELLLQICADDRQVVAHAFRELRGRAPGLGALRWTQEGFSSPLRRGAPRNLLGFHDGTTNPRPGSARFDSSVWTRRADGPAWHAGGSYLVFRKIRIRLPEWDLSSGTRQDETIGRRRDSGAKLASMAPDAHVRRAGGFTMLRRGFNYDYGFLGADADGDGGAGKSDAGHGGHGGGGHPQGGGPAHGGHADFDSGLLFCAFMRDPGQFVTLQRRLARSDRLNDFIEHTGSALFAIPPGCRPGGFVGDALLAGSVS